MKPSGEFIPELEKRKLCKTDRPRKARTAKAETVTREARRAATERDGAQCAWVDKRTLHAEQTFGRDAVERAINHRQQKHGRPDTAGTSETRSKVLDGLKKLGFRAKDARAAVERASSELENDEASPERVLREALWLLSDANVPNMTGHMAGLRAS